MRALGDVWRLHGSDVQPPWPSSWLARDSGATPARLQATPQITRFCFQPKRGVTEHHVMLNPALKLAVGTTAALSYPARGTGLAGKLLSTIHGPAPLATLFLSYTHSRTSCCIVMTVWGLQSTWRHRAGVSIVEHRCAQRHPQ